MSMVPLEQENTEYSMGERRGSAVAHASALVVGVPVLLFFVLFGGSMPLFVALTPCPVVSYMIAPVFPSPPEALGSVPGNAGIAGATVIGLPSLRFQPA